MAQCISWLGLDFDFYYDYLSRIPLRNVAVMGRTLLLLFYSGLRLDFWLVPFLSMVPAFPGAIPPAPTQQAILSSERFLSISMLCRMLIGAKAINDSSVCTDAALRSAHACLQAGAVHAAAPWGAAGLCRQRPAR